MRHDVLRQDESLLTGYFMPATGVASKQRLNGPQLDRYESKTRCLCSYPDVFMRRSFATDRMNAAIRADSGRLRKPHLCK